MSEEYIPLPCPFCGAAHPKVCASRRSCYVRCESCEAEGPWFESGEGDAILGWNRRTSVSGEVAEVPAQGIDHAKRAEGERAAFEAWAPEWFGKLKRCDEPGAEQEYMYSQAQAAWLAWQARGQQAGVPEGCVIVPIIPTTEMVVAIESKIDDQLHASAMRPADMFRQDGETIYEAMIAAAAAPGEAG